MKHTAEELYEKALQAAAKQISYRALSQAKLREKLLDKGHPEDAVDYAIAWLEERNMLNDAAYADDIVHAYERRGYGLMRIRQELYRRGIDKDIAQEALEEFSPNQKQMLDLLEKRLRGDCSDRREVDKAVAALQRRGYLWDDIRTVLRIYREENEE